MIILEKISSKMELYVVIFAGDLEFGWYAVKYYHTKFKDPCLVTLCSLALTVTLLTFEAFFTDAGELLL